MKLYSTINHVTLLEGNPKLYTITNPASLLEGEAEILHFVYVFMYHLI